ncbi:MAG: S8 family serine peptidase [bacterium]|nr:S8 family serine peptidase [bacterium]
MKRLVIFLLTCFVMITNSFGASNDDLRGDRVEVKFSRSFYNTLIQLHDGWIPNPSGNSQIDALMTKHQVTKLEPYFSHDPISMKNESFFALEMETIYKFVLPFEDADKNRYVDISDIVQALKNIEGVEFVELPVFQEAHFTPNDPYMTTNRMWGLDSMHCRQAWDYQQGNRTALAVTIDTGVWWEHPDLIGAMSVNPLEDYNHNGYFDPEYDNDGIDNDGNGFIDDVIGWDFMSHSVSGHPSMQPAPGEDYSPRDNWPTDFHGHGTHVCGTLAARSNNATGIPSAGFNVKTMAVRAGFGYLKSTGGFAGGGYDDDFAAAIQYSVNCGARIISISYGGTGSSSAYQTAVNYARRNNCLVFASAGNENRSTLTYPAACNGVVAVAALQTQHRRADFSNYGTWVDIAAPGVSIWSTLLTNAYNTGPYSSKDGTSMACPNVASVAALVLAHRPTLTDDELEQVLYSTATNIASFNHASFNGLLGRGCVDAARALTAIAPVTVTYPNGGEHFYGNDIWPIRFVTNGIANVNIHLDRDFPSGSWEQIAANIPASSNTFDWTVTYPVTNNARIRVVNSANPAQGDTSGADFYIEATSYLPYYQHFSTTTFPPAGWSQNSTNIHQRWQRSTHANANDGVAQMYFGTSGEINDRYFLWSSPFSTMSRVGATLEFDWCYNPGAIAAYDTLVIGYSLDGGETFNELLAKTRNGTGENALVAGTGGSAQTPAASNWGHCRISLPSEAMNHAAVRVGFAAVRNHGIAPNGPDIYLDNVSIIQTILPVAPTNGSAWTMSSSVIRVSWTDVATDETGYKIFYSITGEEDYELCAETSANTTSFDIGSLRSNTRYYFRIYSVRDGYASNSFASCNDRTFMIQPLAPTVGNITQTTVDVTTRSEEAIGNPSNGTYVLQAYFPAEGSYQYVQEDGTLGATPFVSAPRTITVKWFLPGTSLVFYSIPWSTDPLINNQWGVISQQAATEIRPNNTLPYTLGFDEMIFPPTDCQVMGFDAGLTWVSHTLPDDNRSMKIECYNYQAVGEVDYFLSPYFNTSGATTAHLTFDWSYTPYPGYVDTLVVGYVLGSVGNMVPMATMYSNGTGWEALAAGTGGSSNAPATWGTWGHADILLPAGAINQAPLRFAFKMINGWGANLYIDNIQIEGITPPMAPSSGYIDERTDTSYRLHWTDNANNEWGFFGMVSGNGVNYELLGTVGPDVTDFLFTNLTPNTLTYLRVYAFNAAGISSEYTEVEAWTACAAPQPPERFAEGTNFCSFTIRSSVVPSPDTTRYSVFEFTTGMYLQPDGTLGIAEVKQTLSQWGPFIEVNGLESSNDYWFATTAWTGPEYSIPSNPSSTLDVYTYMVLPYTETFSRTDALDRGWRIENEDFTPTTWRRYDGSNSNDGCAQMPFIESFANGSADILWTPPIYTVGCPTLTLSFDWSYVALIGNDDTLKICYVINDGFRSEAIWQRYASGGNQQTTLIAGVGGSVTYPGIGGMWGHAEIEVPAEVLGQVKVSIGFCGVNGGGSNLFVDNVNITGWPTAPAAPEILGASFSNNWFTLSWAPVQENITYYKIYRSLDPYFTPSPENFRAQVHIAYTEWTDTGVAGQYYYRVTAFNGASTDEVDVPVRMNLPPPPSTKQ